MTRSTKKCPTVKVELTENTPHMRYVLLCFVVFYQNDTTKFSLGKRFGLFNRLDGNVVVL